MDNSIKVYKEWPVDKQCCGIHFDEHRQTWATNYGKSFADPSLEYGEHLTDGAFYLCLHCEGYIEGVPKPVKRWFWQRRIETYDYRCWRCGNFCSRFISTTSFSA